MWSTGGGIEVFDEDICKLMPELSIPVVFYYQEALLEILWYILPLFGQKDSNNLRIHGVCRIFFRFLEGLRGLSVCCYDRYLQSERGSLYIEARNNDLFLS